MATSDLESRIYELLADYDAGLYTRAETISLVLDILCVSAGERSKIWGSIPDWVGAAITDRLHALTPEDELVTFGRGDPVAVRQQLLEMQEWLRTKG
jgi:hypothetical protein